MAHGPTKPTITEESAVGILAALTTIAEAIDSEGAALGKGILLHGDDGVDRKNMHVDAATGHVRAQVRGYVAHDAAASSASPDNPIKSGAVATDYTPDTEGEQGQTAVDDGDIVELSADLKGLLPERVLSKYELLTELDQTYDDAPTSALSDPQDVYRYRKCTLQFDLTRANAPTSIRFTIWVSADGTNYAELANGPLAALIYDDATVGAAGIKQAIEFDICCYKIIVGVTATGTDAGDTFTVDNCALFVRN